MRTLIVYGTNSSGTQAVSGIVADVLRGAGHELTVKRAYELEPKDFSGHDLIVLGSCTWERFEGKQRLEGQLQEHMYRLIQNIGAQKFPDQPFAVFGLGDSSYTDFCAAAGHLESFVTGAGGKLTVPSLRIDGFFFDLPTNRQRAHEWAESLAASTGSAARSTPKRSRR